MRFSEPMSDRIEVRVARDEKRSLIRIARKRGMTLSDFLRETAVKAAQGAALA